MTIFEALESGKEVEIYRKIAGSLLETGRVRQIKRNSDDQVVFAMQSGSTYNYLNSAVEVREVRPSWYDKVKSGSVIKVEGSVWFIGHVFSDRSFSAMVEGLESRNSLIKNNGYAIDEWLKDKKVEVLFTLP